MFFGAFGFGVTTFGGVVFGGAFVGVFVVGFDVAIVEGFDVVVLRVKPLGVDAFVVVEGFGVVGALVVVFTGKMAEVDFFVVEDVAGVTELRSRLRIANKGKNLG